MEGGREGPKEGPPGWWCQWGCVVQWKRNRREGKLPLTLMCETAFMGVQQSWSNGGLQDKEELRSKSLSLGPSFTRRGRKDITTLSECKSGGRLPSRGEKNTPGWNTHKLRQPLLAPRSLLCHGRACHALMILWLPELELK